MIRPPPRSPLSPYPPLSGSRRRHVPAHRKPAVPGDRAPARLPGSEDELRGNVAERPLRREADLPLQQRLLRPDRKSTRLNSSHSQISYAVFCLKKKKKTAHSLPRARPYIRLDPIASGAAVHNDEGCVLDLATELGRLVARIVIRLRDIDTACIIQSNKSTSITINLLNKYLFMW